MAAYTRGLVTGCEVTVALGDISKSKVDAVIVPQFTDAVSYGGVGGAIARSGAVNGMEEFGRFLNQRGEQKFGTAVLTKSGGPTAPNLLHVVSVGSNKDVEFSIIQKAFYNALHTANIAGISSIASPALGTGIIGNLSDKQSAQAMMSAIKKFREDGGRAIPVTFVIYGSEATCDTFAEVLSSQSYASVCSTQAGQKELSIGQWIEEMNYDLRENKKSFDKPGGLPPKPFTLD